MGGDISPSAGGVYNPAYPQRHSHCGFIIKRVSLNFFHYAPILPQNRILNYKAKK